MVTHVHWGDLRCGNYRPRQVLYIPVPEPIYVEIAPGERRVDHLEFLLKLLRGLLG